MTISINVVSDVSKVIAFIRAAAKGKFEVHPDLVKDVLSIVMRYAREHNVKVDIVSPSGERLATFMASGVIFGATAGYLAAQLPGAVIGAAVGGMAGYFAAHIRLQFDTAIDGETVTFSIL